MFANRLAILGSIVFASMGVLSLNPDVQARLQQLNSVRIKQITAKSAAEQADAMERQAKAYGQMIENSIKLIRALFQAIQEREAEQHWREMERKEREFRQHQAELDAQARRSNERLIALCIGIGLIFTLTLIGIASASYILMAGWRKFVSPLPLAVPDDRSVIMRSLPKPLHRPTFSNNGHEQTDVLQEISHSNL